MKKVLESLFKYFLSYGQLKHILLPCMLLGRGLLMMTSKVEHCFAVKLCEFGGLDTMSASDSADTCSNHSSDTEDSSSANTSDSSVPGPHRFEPSESDSKASGIS